MGTDFKSKIKLKALASTTCMDRQSHAGVLREALCTLATVLPGLQQLPELRGGLGGLPENEGNNRTRLSSGCHPDSMLLAWHQHMLSSLTAGTRWERAASTRSRCTVPCGSDGF